MSGERDDLTMADGVDEETETSTESQTEETEQTQETTETKSEKSTEEAGTKAETETEVDPRDQEIAGLRKMFASQHAVIKQFKANQEQLEKRLKGEVIDPEDAEVVQQKLNQDTAARYDQLDTFLEVMRLNPKFEDVDAICSQANVDKLIHTLAAQFVAEKGGDVLEAMDGIAAELWSAKNPYPQMYGLIKEKVLAKPVSAAGAKPTSKTGIKPGVDAPGSIAGLTTGDNKSGGWTSERIDAMSEAELLTVPTDVYEKYMAGTLK